MYTSLFIIQMINSRVSRDNFFYVKQMTQNLHYVGHTPSVIIIEILFILLSKDFPKEKAEVKLFVIKLLDILCKYGDLSDILSCLKKFNAYVLSGLEPDLLHSIFKQNHS